MRDRGLFWSPAPAEGEARFVARDVTISVVVGLGQALVSGARPRAAAAAKDLAPPVGFSGVASGPTYAVAVARDRLLIVSPGPLTAAEGWDAATATALTRMDDAWLVLDLEGPGLHDLIAKGTSLDFADASPSASLMFAGLPCIAYRYERPSRLRLHVERPLAAAFAEWARRA